MQVKAIIADSDGTLVDTVELIRRGQYETLKTYLTRREITSSQVPDYENFLAALHASIGGSARNTLEKTARLLFQDTPDVLEAIDYDALHDLLNPVQDKLAPAYVRPYEGLAELLQFLGDNHISFAISTSGTKHHVVRNLGTALPELGLSHLFQDVSQNEDEKFNSFVSRLKDTFNLPDLVVVTCEVVHTHKPDPASLFYAMNELAVEPKDCLVLGDHAVDMQAGTNAQIPHRIGISHGFHDEESLQRAGATHVIHSLSQLIDMLQSTV